MSGHSHSKTIKHKKDLADAQRGRVFSKMARLISLAAREGSNPDENPKLREALDKAKQTNLPSANIERAIKRGTGEMVEGELQEVLFEAYGPGNIAIIIEGITDNKNRTLSEIKQIFNQYNGRLLNEGSIKWMFEKKGIITINNEQQIPKTASPAGQTTNNKEELELKMIEAGAENFIWRNDVLEIHTIISSLEDVKKKLQENEIKIESSTLGWVAKEEIQISEKDRNSLEKLFEALDESDSVQEIYSNLKV